VIILKKYWLYIVVALVILWALFWKKQDPQDSTTIVVKPGNLSYDLNQYKIFADSIEASLHIGDAWSPYEDDEEVGTTLKRMNTDDDWYQLIKAYGHRETTWPTELNLVETIQAYLDQDVKDDVNQDWSNKGIKSRV
jgi:hypothetical protein